MYKCTARININRKTPVATRKGSVQTGVRRWSLRSAITCKETAAAEIGSEFVKVNIFHVARSGYTIFTFWLKFGVCSALLLGMQ